MPSRSIFLVAALLCLANANQTRDENALNTLSLSFGPLSTHARFDTAPLNPRRPVADQGGDQRTSATAFAEWYIQRILDYSKDSWVRFEEVRHEPTTGVWRVDFQQVLRNGTIPVADGILSLNIREGKVISYADSFYRGPPPDLSPACDWGFDEYSPSLMQCPDYSIRSYCNTLGQMIYRVWKKENPKWSKWSTQVAQAANTRRASDESLATQRRCQRNLDRALEQCIEMHSPDQNKLTSWFRNTWTRFRIEVLGAYRTYDFDQVPPECEQIRLQNIFDQSAPSPYMVADTYNEDTCSWTFKTNRSTTAARLETLRVAHCQVRPPRSCARHLSFDGFDFDRGWELQQIISEDQNELKEEEDIMNPSIAALVLALALPHDDAFWTDLDDTYAAFRKISSHRLSQDPGNYTFELKNVPGTDKPVTASLAYIQLPPSSHTDPFAISLGDEDNEDEDETSAISSPVLTWKLGMSLADGRRYEGYVRASGYERILLRLLDLTSLESQIRALPSPPTDAALISMRQAAIRRESCFGWGEGKAILDGTNATFGQLTSSTLSGTSKRPTYRSLDGPLYWGPEPMSAVWTDILSSVHQAILAHTDTSTNHTSEHDEPTTVTEKVLPTLIQPALTLLPCSPSFIMARDAFIQAEELIFGGKYACDIWRGFAGRGLGVSAVPSVADATWTPWGGGKRKDGFDVPEACGSLEQANLKGNRRREEL